MTELPKGWAPARLSDICDINPRVDKSAIDHTQLVSFVPMPAVEAENGRIDVSATRPFGEVKQGYTSFRTGDVLFAKITPCMENGKMAIVPRMPSEYGFGSTEFHVLRALCGVEPRFIYHIVSNQGFRYHAEHHMTGAVGQKRVPASLLSDHSIAVPPLNEQRRIVQKIEAMFEQIDKGVENLRMAKTTLGLYRQSLLKSAFEGRLTAPWRAQNPDKLEPPKALLARIQKERETRYKSALDDWQTALSEWRASGGKGPKPAKPIRQADLDPKSDLTLGHVIIDVSQGWSPKCKNTPSQSDETWGVIKTTAIQPAHFNDAENKELPDNLEPRAHLELACGDVLITRAGPRKRVGVACMVKQTRPRLLLCDKAYRLTLDQKFISPEFLEGFLNAPHTQDKLEELKSGISDSGLNLTQDKFTALALWLPSLAEQAEITRILDARLTAADAMEAEINAALLRAEALRQSILKQAFAGTLVPQDPTDEPAPTLLARIKAERAKTGTTKKQRTAHA